MPVGLCLGDDGFEDRWSGAEGFTPEAVPDGRVLYRPEPS